MPKFVMGSTKIEQLVKTTEESSKWQKGNYDNTSGEKEMSRGKVWLCQHAAGILKTSH